MTPKEKADELVERYGLNQDCNGLNIGRKYAISCALICANELIKHTPSINTMPPNFQRITESFTEYWQEVKSEIEKL